MTQPPSLLVACPLPVGASSPPPADALLTCRFPCGHTTPGAWDAGAGAVTCEVPLGVDCGARPATSSTSTTTAAALRESGRRSSSLSRGEKPLIAHLSPHVGGGG